MEVSSKQYGKFISENPQIPAEGIKKYAGIEKSRVAVGSKSSPPSAPVRKRVSPKHVASTLGAKKLGLTNSSSGSTTSVSIPRENSSGGLLKKPLISDGRAKTSMNSSVRKKGSNSSSPELKRGSMSLSPTKPSVPACTSRTRKSVPASPVDPSLRKSIASDTSRLKVSMKSSVNTTSPVSSSSPREVASSLDSSCSSSTRRKMSKKSSSSTRSPSVSSTSRTGPSSKISTLSGRRKGPTPETRNSHSIVLPHVEGKASHDVRLDLRGHRVRNLNASGLSSNLEALQRNEMAEKFQQINDQFEANIRAFQYKMFEISKEVREQIEFVHAQFERANARTELADLQLDSDLAVAQKEKDPGPETLNRLSEKLHLTTINDLKKELAELHDFMIPSGGKLGDSIEMMSSLLKRLKNCVLNENPEVDPCEGEKISMKHRSPEILSDFKCPISLELMKDPVIISTGQTYERSCIQKWLDDGKKTCPKTRQTLLDTALIPNYALKNLIALWCEDDGVELPKKQGSCKTKKSGSSLSDWDRDAVIAEAGTIPHLVELLSSLDPQTQEHAVTGLLNLSINESNKRTIVNAGAIPYIVDVLKNGSMEARENAAATLSSLSVLDEYKVAKGAAEAIPALISLLCEGSPRGGMVDEALAILAILANHPEGAKAILQAVLIHQAVLIPILVLVIRTGSPRNGENAAVVLCWLCTGDLLQVVSKENHVQLRLARNHGAKEALRELSENGTARAKREARSILKALQGMEEDNLLKS